MPQNWSGLRGHRRVLQRAEGLAESTVSGYTAIRITPRFDPSLGWRLSDAWLGMAGVGDTGLPNGLPVDDWGIRVEGCRPVGASMARGGALDSPAAVYALQHYIDCPQRYAPRRRQCR
ncbi:MAG: hypothetical protein U5N10_00690 [Gemmobacter sp.]|nr:hypothetical protein [Gemmobacter sp.]